ncbi:MAG: MCP four helix bundle domain-containing protein [Armatimonadetes bacterium]|nr:MCP four helix bundle domain-containing protein [Armatimonadota bacterium]
MKWFKDLSIKSKLIVSFGVLQAVVLILGIYSIHSIKEVDDGLMTVYNDRVVPLNQLKIVSDAYAVNVVDATHKVCFGGFTPAEGAENIANAKTLIDKNWKEYLSTSLTPEEAKLVEEAKTMEGAAKEVTDKIESLMKSGNIKELNKIRETEMYPKIDPLTGKITELADLQVRVAKAEYTSAQGVFKESTAISIGLLIFAIGFGFGIARFLAKDMSGAMNSVRSQLDFLTENEVKGIRSGLASLASGNLTHKVYPSSKSVEVNRKDEFGGLSETLNTVVGEVSLAIESYETARGSLSEALREVQTASETVMAASESLGAQSAQVAESSNGLTQAVSQVAASTEESAIATTRIAEANSQLAYNATTAADRIQQMSEAMETVAGQAHEQIEALTETKVGMELAVANVERTTKGVSEIRTQIDGTSTAVRALGEKGQQIGEIVKTIQDIAEQTNLLALNAAIEAARAGDAGRGFAVVADEVRKLAERASSASGEISELIASVQADVAHSVSATESTQNEVTELDKAAIEMGETFAGLVGYIEKVAAAVESNTTAIQHANKLSGEVLSQIGSVNELSEATAATAQELSATSEENAASAEEMSASVHEQLNSIEELKQMSGDLAQLAESLNQTVSKFELESGSSRGDYLKVA